MLNAISKYFYINQVALTLCAKENKDVKNKVNRYLDFCLKEESGDQ